MIQYIYDFYFLVVRDDKEGEAAAIDSKYFHHHYLRLSLLPVTTVRQRLNFDSSNILCRHN